MSFNHKFYRSLFNIELNNPGSLLEFGCGNAKELSIYQKSFDSRCVGIDAAESIIRFNSQNYSSCEFYKSLDDLDLSYKFDHVFTAHTLEHLQDPYSTLNSLLQLASTSFLAIVPFKESWIECPEHYWYFDEGSFSNAVKELIPFRGLTNKAANTELVFIWHKDPEIFSSIKLISQQTHLPMYRYKLYWMIRKLFPSQIKFWK